MTDVLPVGRGENDTPRRPVPSSSIRQRQSTPQLVADEILGWIACGEYKPSDPLPSERELQQHFGVSRVVVRDALVRLQVVGLVTIEHGRGCYVSGALVDWSSGPFRVWLDLHQQEIINLLKLRRALDGVAAEEMANARDEQALAAVLEAEQAFVDEVDDGADPVRVADRDKDLHVTIARASGMTIIAELFGELDHHSANLHRTAMSLEGRPQRSVRDHRRIVSAIASHDPLAARQAAEEHVTGSIDEVRALIARQQSAAAS